MGLIPDNISGKFMDYLSNLKFIVPPPAAGCSHRPVNTGYACLVVCQ